jgi:hypothetical protein
VGAGGGQAGARAEGCGGGDEGGWAGRGAVGEGGRHGGGWGGALPRRRRLVVDDWCAPCLPALTPPGNPSDGHAWPAPPGLKEFGGSDDRLQEVPSRSNLCDKNGPSRATDRCVTG